MLVQCDDRPGVVAAVSTFLAHHGANITELGQFSTDPVGGRFFQRTVFHLPGFPALLDRMERDFAAIAERFDMTWSLSRADHRKRVALMVSRYDHCLLDLLWRADRGDLPVDPVMVVSNHAVLADPVRTFGVPYFHIAVTQDGKPAAEQAQLELFRGNVDLVVLARYMQVLSSEFLAEVGVPVINIHHSFLPAFMGANPYAQAKARGVKLIGATAHFVTDDLDEGPIIEQVVERVDHALRPEQLLAVGRDVESLTLARAVKAFIERRVFLNGDRTVVFS
ncbi:MAG TPA: formyltetrahydrofolate deformylase [Burkholderia sp.]|nr:formyltetrahydrofolate deformylase [Burkholderia sp.]